MKTFKDIFEAFKDSMSTVVHDHVKNTVTNAGLEHVYSGKFNGQGLHRFKGPANKIKSALDGAYTRASPKYIESRKFDKPEEKQVWLHRHHEIHLERDPSGSGEDEHRIQIYKQSPTDAGIGWNRVTGYSKKILK